MQNGNSGDGDERNILSWMDWMDGGTSLSETGAGRAVHVSQIGCSVLRNGSAFVLEGLGHGYTKRAKWCLDFDDGQKTWIAMPCCCTGHGMSVTKSRYKIRSLEIDNLLFLLYIF